MSARRSPRNRKARSSQSVQFEQLEQRQLLTTLNGGDVFFYKDAAGHTIRITLGGRIRAEFVAGVVRDTTVAASQNARIADLVPASVPDDVDGADLYAIYVDFADPNSYIAITQVDDDGTPIPFAGSAGELHVRDSVVGEELRLNAPDGTGVAYLGARTLDIDGTDFDEGNRPIIAAALPPGGFGLIPPQPNNILRAGLTVANGQSLGAFLFAGTVTGFVNITGSIGDFYAGWLLTGETRGQLQGPPRYRDNFFVNGDARNILSLGSIGTSGIVEGGEGDGPSVVYQTGFDLQVRGALGQIRSGGAISGYIDVVNALGGPFLNRVQREIEFKSSEAGLSFVQGRLTGASILDNDTLDSAQYLGSLNDSFFGGNKGIRLVGTLQGESLDDLVDHYAVSLMAGQRITVQVSDGRGSGPGVGVYDPTGRLIMSDYNQMDSSATLGKEFQFVVERPGIYTFAIGAFTEGASGVGDYSLRIDGVGDIGIGGVVSAGAFINLESEGAPAISLRRGDFGALRAQTVYTGGMDTLYAWYGSARSIVADDSIINLELNLPYGAMGLIQTLSESGLMYISNRNNRMIGGAYQVVDAAGVLTLGPGAPFLTTTYAERQQARGLVTKRGIGVIRAGELTGGSYIEVNAEANLDPRFGPVTDGGRDGVIDLIDIAGDMGSLQTGGPAIVTNFGGNVRYIRVGGDIYKDTFFGGGVVGTTVLLNNDLELVDDGGGRIRLSGARQRNPRFGLTRPDGTPEPEFFGKAPLITYRAYPIRGSGGSVLVSLESDRRLEITSLSTNATGTMATPVEIGRITMTDNAAAGLVVDPVTGFLVQENVPGGLDMDLILRGPAPIDVLEVNAGIIDVISNVSGGEIGRVIADQIHNLYSENIGITRSSTGALVEPRDVLLNTFPFEDVRLGVQANNVANIAASGAIGAVSVSGILNTVVANHDRIDFSPSMFEGIIGPIFAQQIQYVDIGEGLGTSGTGGSPRGGLYATGQIRYVTNNNGNGSIWGNIISQERIAQIVLNNGSIINSQIAVWETLQMSSLFNTDERVVPDVGADTSTNPRYEIVNIEINGGGGVIGTLFAAADFGNLTINGGFGLIASSILSTGDGRINKIIADGYGIRGTVIGGGASVTEVNARGNGSQVNPAAFGRDVRGTAVRGNGFDPRTGFRANWLTDIYRYFGITPANPYRDNVTNSGYIDDSLIIGNIDLDAVYAQRIRRSIFNFGNKISTFQTRSAMNEVRITAGELGTFDAGSHVANLNITVAGPVSKFAVKGDFAETSSLLAAGPSGRIYTVNVQRDLAGNMRTTGFINVLNVGRDVAPTGTVQADDIYVRNIGGQVLGQILIV